MQTKRDQVQAHQTVVGRLNGALVAGEPNLPQRPMRRGTTGLVVGAVLAVMACAGFAVWGLISPGGATSWQRPGTLVVEKETTARYVYLAGVLHPVLNAASARLILGARMRVDQVSQASLSGIPHGPAVGIPAAPDNLPQPRSMTASNWLVCSVAGSNSSGAPITVVHAGTGAPARPMDGKAAGLVRTTDGTTYLLWGGTRLRLADRAAVVGLGYGSAPVLIVASRWLNAIPAGPDLRPPAIEAMGQAGPPMDGRPSLVGQVMQMQNLGTAPTYFVVVPGGLASADEVTAALLLADPRTAAAYPGQPVHAMYTTAAVVAATSAVTMSVSVGLPTSIPHLLDLSNDVPCMSFGLGAVPAVGHLSTVDMDAVTTGALTTGAGAQEAAAEAVSVQPGTGMVAAAFTDTGVDAHAMYLITDIGVKYPLPSEQVATMLGYTGVTVVPVPVSLLRLLPSGPVLDPGAAMRFQVMTG